MCALCAAVHLLLAARWHCLGGAARQGRAEHAQEPDTRTKHAPEHAPGTNAQLLPVTACCHFPASTLLPLILPAVSAQCPDAAAADPALCHPPRT